MVVELDGDVHGFSQQMRHDKERQRQLEVLGFRVLRFTNEEVRTSIAGVMTKIVEEIQKSLDIRR